MILEAAASTGNQYLRHLTLLAQLGILQILKTDSHNRDKTGERERERKTKRSPSPCPRKDFATEIVVRSRANTLKLKRLAAINDIRCVRNINTID